MSSKSKEPSHVSLLCQELTGLPPEGLRQVADTINKFKLEFDISPMTQPTSHSDVEEEAFVGIWDGRSDLADSSQWVRRRRK